MDRLTTTRPSQGKPLVNLAGQATNWATGSAPRGSAYIADDDSVYPCCGYHVCACEQKAAEAVAAADAKAKNEALPAGDDDVRAAEPYVGAVYVSSERWGRITELFTGPEDRPYMRVAYSNGDGGEYPVNPARKRRMFDRVTTPDGRLVHGLRLGEVAYHFVRDVVGEVTEFTKRGHPRMDGVIGTLNPVYVVPMSERTRYRGREA